MPTVPQADAGPLYGIVFPILISVSLTPGSYWLSASATLPTMRLPAIKMAKHVGLICQLPKPKRAKLNFMIALRTYMHEKTFPLSACEAINRSDALHSEQGAF